MIKIKILSSLQKCFMDESLLEKSALKNGSALKGEDYHFVLAYTAVGAHGGRLCRDAALICRSELDISFERIEHMPVRFPCYPKQNDDFYLRKKPGLYPDLLIPMEIGETVLVTELLCVSKSKFKTHISHPSTEEIS